MADSIDIGRRLQPRPPALLPLDLQAGEADARFTLDWCTGPKPRFDVRGRLHVQDANLGWEKARVKGVQTTLRLEGRTSGLFAWEWGYRALFLCEYYLATKDRYVLPAIIEYATKIGTLPARTAAYELPEIHGNEMLLSSSEQVEVGKRMPVVPEMRAIWDAMRPSVQSVWNGAKEPRDAAREMQDLAVKKIREMKG